MSRLELDSIMPVRPPRVNRKMKPRAHRRVEGRTVVFLPLIDVSHLKTLTPVGTAIVIVALVKYARVSMSMPTVNMW